MGDGSVGGERGGRGESVRVRVSIRRVERGSERDGATELEEEGGGWKELAFSMSVRCRDGRRSRMGEDDDEIVNALEPGALQC